MSQPESEPTTDLVKKNEKKRKFYYCHDIEMVNTIVIAAIGACVMDNKGLIHLKKEWWIDCPDDSFDPRRKIFWADNPHLLKKMKEEGRSKSIVMKNFIGGFDSVSDKLGISEKELNLVSDNPEFDWGRLNKYTEMYSDRYPLRYTSEGDYRRIVDHGDSAWALGILEICNTEASKIQEHTHMPSDDAQHIIIKHMMIEKTLKKIKEKYGEEIKEIAKQVCEKVVDKVKKANFKEDNVKDIE